ncbi:MAG: dihydropteroate synthase [Phycisphaerae bacterium]|nr:dihydropteroate synthase [Phycisphaerae bacterium]
MAADNVQILGILNVTSDSFSDGGRFLDTADAVAHGRQLIADGADIIDIGAQSTNPDAEYVTAQQELERLTPVVEQLRADGIRISVDTFRPQVMRAMVAGGAEFINDVTALRDPEAVAAVRDCGARVILMHSTAAAARAERADVSPAGMVDRILAFFERRLAELEAAGIERQRLIIDPGMGLFLSRDPQASLAVLRELPRLARFGTPILVSTSRKGFIGDLLARGGQRAPAAQRGAGTLATELWAVLHGAAYIRTHEPRPLREALRVWRAIERAD